MLLRLIHGSHRIVQVSCRGLLDMAAHNMGDDFAFGECHQTIGAFHKGIEILNVEPTRVEAVSGKQNPALTVVQRNADCVMPRNWHGVKNALSQSMLPTSSGQLRMPYNFLVASISAGTNETVIDGLLYDFI